MAGAPLQIGKNPITAIVLKFIKFFAEKRLKIHRPAVLPSTYSSFYIYSFLAQKALNLKS